MEPSRHAGDNLPHQVAAADLMQGVAHLSRGAYLGESSLELALSVLTESAATLSGVRRAGIWALTDDHLELRCIELFELEKDRHSSGGALGAAQFPEYFAAIEAGEAILADDPYSHCATAAFGRDYLPANGISALLHTPIFIRGQLQGVFSLEQVGVKQLWAAEHVLFARVLANLVTLALVEFEAGEARRDAEMANDRLSGVFNGARDALVLADAASGVVLDLNTRAEALFGSGRRHLLGRHLGRQHPPAQQEAMGYELRQMLAGQPAKAWISEVLRLDGSAVQVEMSLELLPANRGRQYVLASYRPLQSSMAASSAAS